MQLANTYIEVIPFSWGEEATNPNRAHAAWIPWGVDDYYNNYPQRIDEIYANHGIYRRIIDATKSQVEGTGIQAADENLQDAVQEYFQRIGIGPAMLEMLAFDAVMLNGIALQIVPNRAGMVESVVHTRMANTRISWDMQAYWLCPDWSYITPRGKVRRVPKQFKEYYTPKMLPTLAETLSTDGSRIQDRRTSLLVSKRYNPISQANIYPIPEAESVYDELIFGTATAKYWRSYVENGMTASGYIYVPFVPSEPLVAGQGLSDNDRNRQAALRRDIEAKLTGARKAGQAFIVFFDPQQVDANGNPIAIPRIEKPAEEKNDEKYLKAHETTQQTVFTAMGITAPELIGMPSASGFSSQAEHLRAARAIWDQETIRPKQQIIENALNELLRIEGINTTVRITGKPAQQLPIAVEDYTAGLITGNEYRESRGLPKIDELNELKEVQEQLSLPFRKTIQPRKAKNGV